MTTQSDVNGDGIVDHSRGDVTALNADGSRTETISDTSTNGTLIGRTVATVSANGLSVTTQSGSTGDGVFDRSRSDVTRPQRRRQQGRDGRGFQRQWRRGRPHRHHRQRQRPVGDDAIGRQWRRHLRRGADRRDGALNSDGSRTRTVSDLAGSGVLRDRTDTTTNASGTSVSTARDINGDAGRSTSARR